MCVCVNREREREMGEMGEMGEIKSRLGYVMGI